MLILNSIPSKARRAESKPKQAHWHGQIYMYRERSKNFRPCCWATGSCCVCLASLPETHFTAEKEFRLRRKLKLALLPINLSLDFAEDLAEPVKNPARELRRGSASAPAEVAENRIAVEAIANRKSQSLVSRE